MSTEMQQSLATTAARMLATTTKSQPQMQEISNRWLLRMLPWVEVSAGTYRVNRRRAYTVGDRRVEFTTVNGRFRVIPAELGELPALRDFSDADVLEELADRFVQREYVSGEAIVELGSEIDQVILIAHGKVRQVKEGPYGEQTQVGGYGEGAYLGDEAMWRENATWDFAAHAATSCVVLSLPVSAFAEVMDRSEPLNRHVAEFRGTAALPRNKYGETPLDIEAGHVGEPVLPGAFVDYETNPREFELSVVQTVLRIHTRVADLYDDPMDQTEEQLRLTVEAIRERQEHEMINNRDFGLLHNVDRRQRLTPLSGRPTPDDMDELLSRRRSTNLIFAHPKAIAAFGQECSRRGLYPSGVEFGGHRFPAWRDVPIMSCNKIPVSSNLTTSIIAMRVGVNNSGVIGLHKTGLTDEYEPGVSARFMGINDKAIISYLVSAYFSVAVLVPDALGILEGVQVGRSDR